MAVQAEMYMENMGSQLNHNWLPQDNRCGFDDQFAFNLEHQALLQQKLQQQQQWLNQQQNLKVDRLLGLQNPLSYKNFPATTATTSSYSIINHHNAATMTNDNSGNMLSMSLTQSVDALFQKQGREMDAYITLQNKRLKLAYQDYWKQQVTSLFNTLEANSSILLKQKDEEIARARKRSTELEEFVAKLEPENQLWQRVASENENMIMSLNVTIEQLKEKANCSPSNAANDAESCCSVENEIKGKNGDVGMMCRKCGVRDSCVLFLPCRHLCSCVDCEGFFDACPVCNTVKQASIETLF
ncbi:putative BOI-related E3 ubiquitin-protein ligase 3 [Drosera capensis]